MGPCDVIGSRRRKARVLPDVQRLEREPAPCAACTRLRPRRWRRRPRGHQPGLQPASKLVNSWCDDADLPHLRATGAQDGGRLWPRSELAQPDTKLRRTTRGETDSPGRLGGEIVMRPIVAFQMPRGGVLASPTPAQRCATGGPRRRPAAVEEPAEEVEQHCVVARQVEALVSNPAEPRRPTLSDSRRDGRGPDDEP